MSTHAVLEAIHDYDEALKALQNAAAPLEARDGPMSQSGCGWSAGGAQWGRCAVGYLVRELERLGYTPRSSNGFVRPTSSCWSYGPHPGVDVLGAVRQLYNLHHELFDWFVRARFATTEELAEPQRLWTEAEAAGREMVRALRIEGLLAERDTWEALYNDPWHFDRDEDR
jgi:hypothetical protein